MTANGFDPADAEIAARLRAWARDSTPPPASLRARTLQAALNARRPAPATAEHAACFAGAVSALDALADELMPTQQLDHSGVLGSIGTRTGAGWDLVGVLAHLIATDGVLCAALGLPEAVPVDLPPAGPGDPDGRRTTAVLARLRGFGPDRVREIWRRQASGFLREVGDADDPVTFGGVTLSRADCYADRAFETWIHTGDLTARHGLPHAAPARLDQLIAYGVRALRTALADQPDAPVRLTLTGRAAGSWLLPYEGPREPSAEVTADSVEFCRLVGGRRTPETVQASIHGKAPAAGRTLLTTAAAFARL